MSTNYVPETSSESSQGNRNRSRRRRSSGQSGNRGRSRGPRRSNDESSSKSRADEPAKKPGFFAKVAAFFGVESKPEPAKNRKPRTTHPTVAAAEKKASKSGGGGDKPARAPRSGARKPEKVDVTSPRLYVGNLSFDATESDLSGLFAGVGIVQDVEVVANRQTQRSKGFGFVQMQTIDEARRAVDELHDREFMGRKLVVSGAKAAPERREDRESSAIQPEQ